MKIYNEDVKVGPSVIVEDYEEDYGTIKKLNQ